MNKKQFFSIKKSLKKMWIEDGDIIQVPAGTDVNVVTQIVSLLRYVFPDGNDVAVVAGDITKISEAEQQKLGLYRRFDVDGYTAKILIEKIRTAESLKELHRLVGASEEEMDLSYKRLRDIDYIWGMAQESEWGYDHNHWPQPYGLRYSVLLDDQHSFEIKYC